MRSKQTDHIGAILLLLLLCIFPVIARSNWLDAPYNSDGFGFLGNAIYAIFLVILVLLVTGSLGLKILNRFLGFDWTYLEKVILSLSIGLGLISLLIFGLGLIGLIEPQHFAGLIFLIGIASINEFKTTLKSFSIACHQILHTWNTMQVKYRILCIAGALTLLFTFLQTLTPPFDYDGLMYHLQGPRLFLEAGKIYPDYENWFTFYPFSWEMIYMLGLGLGSDIFARLIHFSTFLLILASTYSFGSRFLPKPGGWLSVAILLGIPVIPLWSAQAYTDLSIVLYQFLTFGLFLLWISHKNRCLLVLSGLMQGFAIGNKYLSFAGTIIIGCLVLLISWQNNPTAQKWRISLTNGFVYGASALVIASPWFIKNLIWTANPIFPFFFSANGLDPLQLKIWFTYVQGFGTGKEWYDYLLIPINLFTQNDKFGTTFKIIDYPSPFFLLVFCYPLIKRNQKLAPNPMIIYLIFISLLQFIFWAIGSQQTRFLLPIYPNLCLISSYILISIAKLTRNSFLARVTIFSTIAGCVISTTVVVFVALLASNPFPQFGGFESKSNFLSRMTKDYHAIEYINHNLPQTARVLMLWDGRGYYCENRCLPDIDQSRWTAMVQKAPTIPKMNKLLNEMKITHILYSHEDVIFFLLEHDRDGNVKMASDFFLQQYAPACTRNIYQNEEVGLFEIYPQVPTCK